MVTNTPNPASPPTARSSRKNWIVLTVALALGGLAAYAASNYLSERMAEIDEEVKARRGGLPGCSMVSDAFFPFRDGAEVGIREGITAIVQPGGALRDWDVIDCCNDANVAMVFTGQRSFRH